MIIGAGAKLPTGKHDLSEDGIRIHSELQPGTGTTDEFGWLTYTAAYNSIGVTLYSLYKINGENDYGEKITNNTLGQFTLFYKTKKKNWFILPSLQATYEYTKGMMRYGVFEETSGMNLLTGGIGLDLYYKNIGINGTFQLPLLENTSANAMSNSCRIGLGVTYSFNQTKYLLNTN